MTTNEELMQRLQQLTEQIEELESVMPDDAFAEVTVNLDAERAKLVHADLTKIAEGQSGGKALRLLATSLAMVASAVCHLRQDFEEYKEATTKKQKGRK